MEIVRTPAPIQLVPQPTATNQAALASASLPKGLASVEAFGQEEECAKKKLLVFDRDGASYTTVNDCLDETDFEIVMCRELDEVIAYLQAQASLARQSLSAQYDLLLWGLNAPYEEDLNEVIRLRQGYPDVRMVLLAAHEALAFAPTIKMANAEAFLLKPLRASDVRSVIERVLDRPKVTDHQRASGAIAVLSHEAVGKAASGSMGATSGATAAMISGGRVGDGQDLGLIGSSPEMLKVVSMIRKIGRSNVNVLVTGESGTGKEMVASAIHKVSDRAGKPFIAINCAAIPRELLESELFGHAKGAFTGASAARRGLFEEANEGTILLDEIGDLPMSLQAKILRLLQTRQVKPLGQNTIREVDVRIISATHKNLKALIQKGEFREDLYYRLNVMPVHLPPLRDRKEDILLLAEHFLKRFAEKNRQPPLVLTKKAAAKLQNLQWKGNVRELENVIERAIVLSDGRELTEDEILTEEIESVQVSAEDLFNAGMSLKDIEREYIKYVLGRTGNRK